MKAKILTLLLVLFIVALSAGAANAQLDPTIEVKDLSNNVLNGQTVYVNTNVIISCQYIDAAQPSSTGYIDAWLDQGSGFVYLGNVWTGPVNSGQTIQSPQYTLSQIGTYKFTWTVQGLQVNGAPCPETAQVATTIRLHIPEPATLAGLAMALSAFGFLAAKRKLKK
jgi:hypothetical protein